MPEDHFSDLGNGKPRGTAERFVEEDRLRPDPDPDHRRPDVTRQGNRYAWAVAFVALMGIGMLLFTTALPNSGKGIRSLQPGERIPDFAARLATAPLAPDEDKVDANVCQRASECNEQVGTVPACSLRFEGFFNVCEARKKPLVLTFVFDEGADCNPQVDRVERMKDGYPGVNFAVVYFSDKDRAEVGEIVRRRKWTMPVAHTPDGAVVNLYGVGVCPITIFVRKGGVVLESVLGPISEEGLRRQVRRLARG